MEGGYRSGRASAASGRGRETADGIAHTPAELVRINAHQGLFYGSCSRPGQGDTCPRIGSSHEPDGKEISLSVISMYDKFKLQDDG